MSDHEKTYEELKSEAARKWMNNSMIREGHQQEQMARILQSPDVVNAPKPDDIYSHPAIVCQCHGFTFSVQQWACCNGRVEVAVLRCRTCEQVQTYDFRQSTWVKTTDAVAS